MRPTDPAASRARFCLFVSLVWLGLVLFGRSADAQLSSSLGGDLAGKPSQARVVRVNGFPVANVTPTVGDVWKWNGSAMSPDVDQVGEGGGDPFAFRLATVNTSSTSFIGTTNVTVYTFTVSSTYAVPPVLVSGSHMVTLSVTGTTSLRFIVYLNGRVYKDFGIKTVTSAGASMWGSLALWFGTTPTGGLRLFRGGFSDTVSVAVSGPPATFVGGLDHHGWFTQLLPDSPSDLYFELVFRADNNNPSNLITSHLLDVWVRP